MDKPSSAKSNTDDEKKKAQMSDALPPSQQRPENPPRSHQEASGEAQRPSELDKICQCIPLEEWQRREDHAMMLTRAFHYIPEGFRQPEDRYNHFPEPWSEKLKCDNCKAREKLMAEKELMAEKNESPAAKVDLPNTAFLTGAKAVRTKPDRKLATDLPRSFQNLKVDNSASQRDGFLAWKPPKAAQPRPGDQKTVKKTPEELLEVQKALEEKWKSVAAGGKPQEEPLEVQKALEEKWKSVAARGKPQDSPDPKEQRR